MRTTPLEDWIIGKTCMGEGSRKQLKAYQLRKIRETVNYAKRNSRFYGGLLEYIDEDEIRSLEDMRKISFTFPQDLQRDPFSFLCVPQNEIKRIVTLRSTGTSGNEKRVFFTEEDLDHTIDFFIHGMRCLVDERDRVMVLLPGSSFGSIGDLLKKALEKTNIECCVHGVVVDPEETAKEIMNRDITCLVGIPIQVLQLSRMKNGIFGSRIKTVLLSTDYVPEVLNRELTDRCGCRVFTHYGLTETGYGGGVECEALDGYHMREADLYFEIVDPVSGQPVPDGQWGEAVFTTLTRKAMPLIRYRTGDRAAFSSKPCACGTFLKTMQRVRGRLDNKISLCGNEVLYLAELDEIILAFGEVRDYRACFSAQNGLNIEIVTDSDSAFWKLKNEIAGSIQRYINGKLGCTDNLTISVSRKNEPDKISNSMVKRTIRDLRQKI